ncbi:MAG: hypothetical protein QOF35_357 [Actinomycetota bacterium]|jgi:cell division septum initiation protein DivIVA|nr:hypothetical protein [Actinomycetota bacterium]
MDIHDRLDQLAAMVRNAKPMPMSASCLVNRAEMLEVVDRMRVELPANLNHADALWAAREAVLTAGREEVQRIVADAHSERARLIEQSDVLQAARALAATATTDARVESTRLLADADDYVDRKLGEFESFLSGVTSQVNNGRLRLTARREADLAHFQPETGSLSEAVSGAVTGQAPVTRHPVAEPGSPSDPQGADHHGPASSDAAGVPAGVGLGAR